MMKLGELLAGVAVKNIAGDTSCEITSLELDSRRVGAGSLFFAVPGAVRDGHDYIDAALDAGAAAVVCERMPERTVPGAAIVGVESVAVAMPVVASNFFGNPSAKLKLVGVTGTNGKTTTATLLYDLFRNLGYEAGLVSTVVYKVGPRETEAPNTTPDAITLNRLLAAMVDAGCEYCFMEVSSHGIVQNRIGGLHFAGGVFTNLTHDHLDYHGTFAEYVRAKKAFFDTLPTGAFALVNTDDRNGRVMVQNTRATVRTMSVRGLADFTCRVLEQHADGMLLKMDGEELWVNFLGKFNAANLLAVYGAARLSGAEKGEVLRAMSTLVPVRGRFEFLRSPGGVTAIVDYAHTPDALQNVIDTATDLRGRDGKLIVVVGCGGDRDAAKRPVMGRIAAAGGDVAILTSDNPRGEDPMEILAQMKAGVGPGRQCVVVADRGEAIRSAVVMARPGDVVIVAGKGHETYQDTGGVRRHFDDREEVDRAFGELGK